MNILLVDDDRFVLAALNQNMDWNRLGITEVYSALNITLAKEIINEKQVHILITDIDMPQGSGIDLLAWIREKNYEIQTIFLTNYADFHFAQKAVELQSLEYYLKPIEFDKLALIVQKAVKKVESVQKTNKAVSMSNIWEDIKSDISEHFFSTYLKQEGAYTEKELQSYLSKNHLPYKMNDTFTMILFDLYTISLTPNNEIAYCYADENRLHRNFHSTYQEVFKDVLSSNDVLLEENTVTDSFVAIINSTAFDAKTYIKLQEYCEKLMHQVKVKYQASLSCYIGLPSTFSDFHHTFMQLQSLQENMIDCQDKVFLLKDYIPIPAEYSVPNLNLLNEYLRLENRSLFVDYCNDYLFSLSLGHKLNYIILTSFQIDIIQLVYSYLRDKGILAHKLIQGKTNDLLLELSVKSIQNMILYITYLINTALDYAAFSASGKSVASIICEFIDIHFTEDINRNSLAEIVYLDPDYTARLFKKETGVSVVNYIIEKRIHLAKDLLTNTTLSVNLISDKVGYGNYSYFTKLFKKETGYTPVDYRKMKKIS